MIYAVKDPHYRAFLRGGYLWAESLDERERVGEKPRRGSRPQETVKFQSL